MKYPVKKQGTDFIFTNDSITKGTRKKRIAWDKEENQIAYIERSRSLIYNENIGKTYKHFELIKRLYKEYPETISREIKNLDKLTDSKIEEIVRNIPNYLMIDKQKEYIIKFLTIRREILRKIIN